VVYFFFSSRRRHTSLSRDCSSDVCSSDLLRLNKPELRIEVDREKAADMGVSVEVVAKALETMLGGRIVTRYKRDAEQYDVIVQTSEERRVGKECRSRRCRRKVEER